MMEPVMKSAALLKPVTNANIHQIANAYALAAEKSPKFVQMLVSKGLNGDINTANLRRLEPKNFTESGQLTEKGRAFYSLFRQKNGNPTTLGELPETLRHLHEEIFPLFEKISKLINGKLDGIIKTPISIKNPADSLNFQFPKISDSIGGFGLDSIKKIKIDPKTFDLNKYLKNRPKNPKNPFNRY